jgi:spermidine/putrescine-binding protein
MKIIIVFAVLLCTPLSMAQNATPLVLRILCWEGYAAPEYVAQFEAETRQKHAIELSIEVENVSDPADFFNKIRDKKVDIISPAHNIPKSERWPLIERGIVLPINLDNVPHYRDIIPELQHADYISVADQVYGVPIVYGPYGLMYNSAIIPEAPESWTVLWEAEYGGRYAISQDYFDANIYVTALSLGFDAQQIFDYQLLRRDPKVLLRLAQLVRHAQRFWVGVDSADDLQGLALATGWGFAIPELQKRGETWKMANPKEGTTGWVDNWMIGHSLKDRPVLKQIAEEWINFSLSPEIQAAYVRNIAQHPVNFAAKKHLSASESLQFHLDDPSYFKNNLLLWKVLPIGDQNGFQMMWRQAEQARSQ